MPAKRYFEYSEGSSNKFWEVWCSGNEVFTRYGKIGSQGQLTVKDTGSKADAKKLHDKLAGEKTRKGYVESRGSAGAKKPSKGEAEAPAADEQVEVPEGTLRLELDGKKKKFWQILRTLKTVVVTAGDVGTPGKSTKKTHKDEWVARSDYNKQLAAQLAKGFQYVVTGKGPKKPAVPATDPQQEKRILEDGASDDALAVYADWLQEQGDVRGELAALQLQAAKKPNDKKLANAVGKLLWDYRAYFYGALAPYVAKPPNKDSRADRAIEDTWRAGWLDVLALGAVGGWSSESVPTVNDPAMLVALLPQVPSAKFLRELVITRARSDGEYNFAPAIAELPKVLPKLPALRRLTIGRFGYEDSELSWSQLGAVGPLWKVGGNLEYVKLRAGSMNLGKIKLPACREFRIETGGLAKSSLGSVIAASWPELETLSLWFGKEDYGCTCKAKDTAPLLDGKALPKVKHLGLKNSQFGDEIMAMLATSKILRQLKTLDLSMSHITSATLEALAPHKAAFAHLEELDLSKCLIEDEQLAKGFAKRVNLEQQREQDDYEIEEGYRYAAVGE